ncbi:DUF3784 domain-containing protein [Methanonatronarchaeum sp. AMET6-2]|uniref:DUF3784 domain-containing protein n=1 Tax=Methanonatronarchaeum sp. AMET6-2 TaxID=2933293 RepID=UPI00353010DF
MTGWLFIVLGFLVRHFGFVDLIAGYNTMPDTKKEIVDVVFLRRGWVIVFFCCLGVLDRYVVIGL